MALDKLKKELVAYIENTNDEELLSLVKEDLVFYGKTKGRDITDQLSETQLNDLRALSEEDWQKDSMTIDEFNEATKKWRTKL